MINEAVACYDEQVVDNTDLLDAGVVFGTGFAPFTGGPIHYARQIGFAIVHGRARSPCEAFWDALHTAFRLAPVPRLGVKSVAPSFWRPMLDSMPQAPSLGLCVVRRILDDETN